MRIVFLMPSYPPDSFGGAERHAAILAEALTRQGAGATILAPTSTPGAAGVRDERGVRVVRIFTPKAPYLGGRYTLSMLLWWRRAYRWLAAHREEYDAISVQHLRLHAMPGLIAAQRFGKLLSAKIGRGGAHFDLRRLQAKRGPFGRMVLSRALGADMVFIANSREIVDDLGGFGVPAARIVELPNGVETPARSVAAFAREDGARRFVFAGRLEREKGVLQLLDAFSDIAAAHPDARLDIFGRGPLEPSLRIRVDARGLGGRVRVLGHVEDRAAIYGGAAFFLLPSDSEGLSNALLEAMAHGAVPVITPVSGAADLVTDGANGLMLADNETATIAAALARCMGIGESGWAKMSLAARGVILSGYDIDTVARRYLDLKRECAAKAQEAAPALAA